MRGVRLLFADPMIATRSCADCERYVFRDGEVAPATRHGKQVLRRGKPPCGTCPKCAGIPDPTPEDGRHAELTPKNWMTIRAYWEHDASPTPADAVRRKNFGLIREALAAHGHMAHRRLEQTILLLTGSAK